jgi:hypothetical protein
MMPNVSGEIPWQVRAKPGNRVVAGLFCGSMGAAMFVGSSVHPRAIAVCRGARKLTALFDALLALALHSSVLSMLLLLVLTSVMHRVRSRAQNYDSKELLHG